MLFRFNHFCNTTFEKIESDEVEIECSIRRPKGEPSNAKRSHVSQKKLIANLALECYRCSSSTVNSQAKTVRLRTLKRSYAFLNLKLR